MLRNLLFDMEIMFRYHTKQNSRNSSYNYTKTVKHTSILHIYDVKLKKTAEQIFCGS